MFLLRKYGTNVVFLFLVVSIIGLIYYLSDKTDHINTELHHYPWTEDMRGIHLLPNYTGHCLSISNITIPYDEELYEMPILKLSCLYHRHLTSLQSLCTDPRRYGNVKYGGFRICVDDDVAPINGCTIYSFNHDLSKRFNQQMEVNFKCKIMSFGQTLNSSHIKTLNDFTDVLLQHNSEISIVILKLNFNDAPFLHEFCDVAARLRIKQIILEIHHGEGRRRHKSFNVKILSMFRKLNDLSYRIYWFDRNWNCFLKGSLKCLTVNLYLTYQNKPSISNQIDLPNLEPFGAKPMNKNDKQKYESFYWGYISHHQILCKSMVRLGKILDGGWDICHDIQFRPRSPCIVYSFGINYDFSFDDDVSKTYGCDVFAFDPSMNMQDHNRSQHIKFYKLGIGEDDKEFTFHGNKWKLNNLKTIQKRLKHTNRRIDVLKMDIEDNELQTLPEMIESGAMKNVAQFCLEFHNYYDLGTLRKLYDLGFRIYWSHQNPEAKLYENNRSYSYGNDVYFVNINLPK